MEKISTLLTILSLLAFNSFGELSTTHNGTYKWKDIPVMMTRVNIDGTSYFPAQAPIASTPSQEFIVIGNTPTHVVLKVLNYAYFKGGTGAVQYEVVTNFYIYNFGGTQANYNGLRSIDKNTRRYGVHQMYFEVPIAVFTNESLSITPIPNGLQSTVKPPTFLSVNHNYDGVFRWTSEPLIRECTSDGRIKLGTDQTRVKNQQIFRVVGDRNDSLIVLVYNYIGRIPKKKRTGGVKYGPKPSFYTYNFSGTTAQYNALDKFDKIGLNYGEHQKYFVIHKSVLDKCTEPSERIGFSLDYGVLSLPIKIRFDNDWRGNFSNNINLTGAIGLGFKHYEWRKFRYSVLATFGVTNATLDSSSVARNVDLLESTNSLPAFSMGFGGMIQYKDVQVGLYIGADHLSTLNHDIFGWKYQGKPWVGLAVGYSIFSHQQKDAKGKAELVQ